MKHYRLIFLFFVACLTSCTVVQYVNVPVNYGPKIFFHPDTTHVLVINHYTVDSAKFKSRKKLGVFKAGAYSAVKCAATQIGFLAGVRVTNLVDSVNFVANNDSIKVLAEKYKAKYILALDEFNAGITLDNVESYDGGQTAYYNTIVKVGFTLYENNGIFFKKLGGIANDPQSDGEYPGLMASLLVHPTIGGNGFSINNSACNATLDALKDYLPYTITNRRPLYTDDDDLKNATTQILAGKFDLAFKILNPLIDGKNPSTASKAAYNLAVVYEAQGDLDEAETLAKLSNQKQQNDYAIKLIADLIKE
jgi:tetratricopeptide (TPR) repeat protein